MKICIVGHGMMGRWHSEALIGRTDCCLHTLVGRKPESTAAFAEEFKFKHWTTSLNEALGDDDIDAVIVASPSESHAAITINSLMHDKHTLVELPMALSEWDAERVIKLASERKLILGAVHPVRFIAEMRDLRLRLRNGEEHVRQMVGKFYTHRLENVGATGYQRSWTDNILWHHTLHLLDLGVWLLDRPITKIHSFMPSPDKKTGTPMDVFYGLETDLEQYLIFVGSYFGQQQIHEMLIVTNRDTYKLDLVKNKFITSKMTVKISSIQEANANLTSDFVAAVTNRRETFVSGVSVMPAIKVLQKVQDNWDVLNDKISIPGRELKH